MTSQEPRPNQMPSNPTVIVHDLRKWGGSEKVTKDPLAAAWVRGLLLVGIQGVRRWCFAWNAHDPCCAYGITAGSRPSGNAHLGVLRRGRGATSGINADHVVFEHPIRITAASWAWFLGLAVPWRPPNESWGLRGGPDAGNGQLAIPGSSGFGSGEFVPWTGLTQHRLDGPNEPLAPIGAKLPKSWKPSLSDDAAFDLTRKLEKLPREELAQSLIWRYLELIQAGSLRELFQKMPVVVPKSSFFGTFILKNMIRPPGLLPDEPTAPPKSDELDPGQGPPVQTVP